MSGPSTSTSSSTLVDAVTSFAETTPLLGDASKHGVTRLDDVAAGEQNSGHDAEGREVEVYEPGKSTFLQTVSDIS